MPHDLKDLNSLYRPDYWVQRQIEEANRLKQMQDLVNPPGLRIMQDLARRQTAVSAAYEVLEEAERRKTLMTNVVTEQLRRDDQQLRANAIMNDLMLRDAEQTNAVRLLTNQLREDGLLAEKSRALLAAVGVFDDSAAIRESPLRSEAARLALGMDRTMTSVAAMMNDRLRTFGTDPLTAATLSTAGIAAQIAQITQTNAYARSLMHPQWDAFGRMSAAVERLYALPDIVERLQSLPGYLAQAPVVETYASARSLSLFTRADVRLAWPRVRDVSAEELLDSLSEALAERLTGLDQDLATALLGAWAAARSENPDRVRHVATSMRTVIQDVIRMIAPRDRAEAWARARGFRGRGALPNGARGVRSAKHWAEQLRYVFRVADGVVGGEAPVSQVAESDLADMLLLLERLEGAVHRGRRVIPFDDLTLVLRRGAAFLTQLLDANDMRDT